MSLMTAFRKYSSYISQPQEDAVFVVILSFFFDKSFLASDSNRGGGWALLSNESQKFLLELIFLHY